MHAANLILHAGAHAIERTALAAVATPERTATWVPLPHDRLLSGIQSTLEHAGLSVVTEAHGLTNNGARYFGLLQVKSGSSQDDGDFGLVVGIRNSHDKTFPAGLVVGASVFVCDNLSFSGEIKLARKHTVYVERDLPNLIERAVGQLGELHRTQGERFAGYKHTQIGDSTAHDLIVRALDARVIPVTLIPDVLKEWREPSHPEFAQDRSAWRLFQAFTESLKSNLDALPKRTIALHGILDLACGLVVRPHAMAV